MQPLGRNLLLVLEPLAIKLLVVLNVWVGVVVAELLFYVDIAQAAQFAGERFLVQFENAVV